MWYRFFKLVRSYYHIEIHLNGRVIHNDAYVDVNNYADNTSCSGQLKTIPYREDWAALKEDLREIEQEIGMKIDWEVEVPDPLYDGRIYNERTMIVGVEDYLFPEGFWKDRLNPFEYLEKEDEMG